VIAKQDKKPPGWKVGRSGDPAVVVMELHEWCELVAKAYSVESRKDDAGALLDWVEEL
jgi:hypothetical protein